MGKEISLSPQEEKAIASFREEMGRILPSREWSLRLFGSRARGEGDEGSDLDLLVLINNLDAKTKLRVWDAAYRVFDRTEILISPLVLSVEQFEGLRKRERLIALDIEREGVPL